MTVQELFISIDETEFITEYLKHNNDVLTFIFSSKETPKQIFKKINLLKNQALETFRYFKKLRIQKNNKYILFSIPRFDGDTESASFLVERKDVLNFQKGNRVETFGFEFTPHNELLGCDISLTSIQSSYSDIYIALSIFNEMTFLSLDEKTHTEKSNKILAELKEYEKEKNDEKIKYNSMDDLCNALGCIDKRSKEQKDFDMHLLNVYGKNDVHIFNDYLIMEQFYIKNERG